MNFFRWQLLCFGWSRYRSHPSEGFTRISNRGQESWMHVSGKLWVLLKLIPPMHPSTLYARQVKRRQAERAKIASVR